MPLSIVDNSQLTSDTEALAGLDANDTLLAVAIFTINLFIYDLRFL